MTEVFVEQPLALLIIKTSSESHEKVMKDPKNDLKSHGKLGRKQGESNEKIHKKVIRNS